MGMNTYTERTFLEVLGRSLGKKGNTMEGISELKVRPLIVHFPGATSLQLIDPVKLCVYDAGKMNRYI